jgi:uncharacterized protein (TIGR03435 family)
MLCSHLFAWAAIYIGVAFDVTIAQTQPPRPAFNAFEEAIIKPTHPNYQVSEGRLMAMQSAHRFTAQHYTLRALIAAGFNLNPEEVLGGPDWIDSERYDILALTPNDVRPGPDEQMKMLRKLLVDRFNLQFHREHKVLAIYVLTVTKKGSKLKESSASSDDPPVLVNRVFRDLVLLPARNATMAQFSSMMQRMVLDRPVVDKTGLSGRYDFDLEWAPNSSQFGGQGPPEAAEPVRPGIFTALQEQLGLRLEATKGPVEVLVVDKAERPSEN